MQLFPLCPSARNELLDFQPENAVLKAPPNYSGCNLSLKEEYGPAHSKALVFVLRMLLQSVWLENSIGAHRVFQAQQWEQFTMQNAAFFISKIKQSLTWGKEKCVKSVLKHLQLLNTYLLLIKKNLKRLLLRSAFSPMKHFPLFLAFCVEGLPGAEENFLFQRRRERITNCEDLQIAGGKKKQERKPFKTFFKRYFKIRIFIVPD